MSKNFYITTTIPYVNAEPHVGFALEIVQADALARLHSLMGDEVFFNTGTDEHGQKIWQAAAKEGKGAQEFTDYYAEKFRGLTVLLDLYPDIRFIRTTSPHHVEAAREFWKRCEQNGDIYKKNYRVKYCVGCELEKTDSELSDGKCPLHPNVQIEIREEENYFFRLSKYENPLKDFYEKVPDFVFPDFRFNEAKEFVKKGLQDFSISRLKSKLPWGVPVPGDDAHVMYVWFDAFINYISTLGWPALTSAEVNSGKPATTAGEVNSGKPPSTDSSGLFERFWAKGSPIQMAGKDQIRMQAIMWQAMLLSAGLPNTRQVFIHGFITSGGQKMSKSLGNIVDPVKVVEEYGTDALRYFLLREVHPFEDSDFTMEKFKDVYNANLANGLGNLVSRIMKMAQDHLVTPATIAEQEDMSEYFSYFEKYEFNKAMDYIWQKIGDLDRTIQETQPFRLVKTDKEAGVKIIVELVVKLYSIARMLNPMMPGTSGKIKKLVKENRSPEEPLFLRK